MVWRRIDSFLALLFATGALWLITGCEQAPPDSPRPAKTQKETGEHPSQWQQVGPATLVALPEGEEDAEMTAAIAEARSTAEEARLRWQIASPTECEGWAIKWAAPTRDGRVEYLWVRPDSWSRFRIEGRLLSAPVADLECGAEAGDPVSLPIEELSDWVYLPDGDFQGQREGGFTVKLLEQRYGVPDTE
jgi:uncharacterized protein YegJ (DUF2314 family)